MSFGLYDWQTRFGREGLTYGLRSELLELLRPHVSLKPPLRLSEDNNQGVFTKLEGPARIKDLVQWEIVLDVSDVHEVLGTLSRNLRWRSALPDVLPDLTSLLLEALDLMRQLEGADEQTDGSYWYQPSIAEHPQNQKFRDWTALIDLTRDSWVATATSNPKAARAEVLRWLAYSYPLFHRLAFFAATETDLFPPNISLQWLLSGENWWLWSVETKRETLRLMVKLAKTLPTKDSDLLQLAILQGPPRAMFSEDTDAERLRRVIDHETWLRLTKFRISAGKPLNIAAAETLARISEQFPEWKLEIDESDEFPVWMGDAEDWYKKQITPKELPALEEYLSIERDHLTNDDWFDRCKNDFSTAISALINLGQRQIWPAHRWRTALQVWTDPVLLPQSWSQLKKPLKTAPDNVITSIAQPLSWWLQALGKIIAESECDFFLLVRRVLETQLNESFDGGNDPIFKAINHPVGQATDAVFRWWYRQNLEDGQGLKGEPRGIYSDLCNLKITSFRYGRIILAANMIALFRVDREWTERQVLRNLDWQLNFDEARAAWSGFLWAPRLHVPLLASIKREFLATVEYYDTLGQFAQQYASLLTYVALEAPEPFTRKELALATSLLPPEGLARCAFSLVQSLDSAGEKRIEYWQNRIRPYLKDVWPKSVDAINHSVANSFARLCMKADDAFPEAVVELKPWLSRATGNDVTLHEFRNTQLAKRFPEAALTFLDTVLAQRSFVLVDDLKKCLSEIREGNWDLENDPRFENLTRYVRQLGG